MKIATIPGFEFQLMGHDVARAIGADFIKSQPATEELLLFGDSISPDNWCLDVKIIYGSIVKAVEEGADTIFVFHYAYSIIGYGPCLLPWACDNYFEPAIKKMFPERKIHIYSLEWWNPALLAINITRALNQSGHSDPTTLFTVTKSLKESWDKIAMLQRAKDLYYKIGALDYKKYNKMYHDLVKYVYSEPDIKKIEKKVDNFIKDLSKKIPQSEKLLKIGVLGDFYTLVLEHYPFFNIEELMMRDLKISLVQPFSFFSIFDKAEINRLKPYKKRAKKYIKYWMGGSDYYTIPLSLLLKDEKVEGIVHASVFACHPEAISRNVFKVIDQTEGLPAILELTFDSHTQIEAVKVRLEAFIDMLQSRKGK